MKTPSTPQPSQKIKRSTEATGFAAKTIIVAILWTVLLGASLGITFKYGIELSQLVATNPSTPPHEGPVRIGVFNWVGYYPLVVAKELGLFEKQGIQVELVHAKSVGELNDLIRTGRTQVSVGVLADFIVLRRLGTPIRMMVASDYSISDVILASPKIKNAKDLAGKRIGLAELDSFAQYFVFRSLELAGVNSRLVNFYTVAPEKISAAILSGEIDAGHIWNPYLAEGISRGLKPVLSTADNPQLAIDGIVFRAEVSEDTRIPMAVTRAFFESLALIKSDPVAFASASARYFGISNKQAQKFIDEDVRFADLDENIRLYGANGVLRKEANAIGSFFAEHGMGGEDIDIKSLIDDSIIRQLEDERAIGETPREFGRPAAPKSTAALPLFPPVAR